MPELVLESNGRTWTLDPSRSYSLGRDPRADIVLDDARVSWRHATVRCSGGGWVIEDLGSTNGTYVQGRRIHRMEIGPGSMLHLGNAADGPRLNLSGGDAVAADALSTDAVEGAEGADALGAPGEPWPRREAARQAHQAPATGAGAASTPLPRTPASHAPAPHIPAPHIPAPQPLSQQYPSPQAVPPHTSDRNGPGSGSGPDWAKGPPSREGAPYIPRQQAARQNAQRHAAHENVVQNAAQQGDPSSPAHHGDCGPTPSHRLDLGLGRVMRIGRALENELVVSDLQVSRHHAEFRAAPDGRFEIRDLGSHNGTYVNGQPLARSGAALIGANDVVGVGHSTFRLVGDRLEEFVDTGEVTFSARHLTVTVDGGKQILRDVSFGVPEKSLIAVIGPSGSGKSTLLKALTGYRPADQGDVLYDNRNLYKQFAELRRRIGLVPQDDILHKELSVQKALRYAAKLRFSGDTAASEREARIDEVLRELRLDVHRDKKVTALSGGQRKRVSVALELLTKPSLIFLDEPTSGLDPGMDRDVMQLLRGLADDGRTVLVVTHSVAELALCDRLLVLAPGGGVAYFGPPEEALNFFRYKTWADVFSAFENYRDYDWMSRWRGSAHYRMYAADIDAVAPQSVAVQPPPARTRKSQSWGSQLWTLMRRYVSVLSSDRGFLGLMLILPAVLGVVSVLIPSDFGLGYGPLDDGRANRDAATILMILAVGMCFAGAANSVRELIKERVIYERERATGLSRSAYLMSKVIVLGCVTAVQGAIMSVIAFVPRRLPDQGVLVKSLPALELTLAVVALGFTTMMFGLAVSALVRTAERTMPLLVMFAIVQIVFTGVLSQLFDVPVAAQIAWLMPSRWAVAAMGATTDLNTLLPWEKGNPDPLWEHTAGVYGLDMGALLALGVVLGFVVVRLLRRHEPEVMRK